MQGKTHICGGVCLALLLTETGIYNTGGSVSDVGIMLLTAGIGSFFFKAVFYASRIYSFTYSVGYFIFSVGGIGNLDTVCYAGCIRH